MNRSILISSVLHLILIMITAFSLPFLAKKPINLPPIISVELIQITDKSCEVIWDKSKPTGDRKRIMDTQRARNELNFIPTTSLKEGLKKTVNWFLKITKIILINIILS